MGDQVVVGDIYDEVEEDSFFQDVDMLQSYGIVSWITNSTLQKEILKRQ